MIIKNTILNVVLSTNKQVCIVYFEDESVITFDFKALNINYIEGLNLIYLKYSYLDSSDKMAA